MLASQYIYTACGKEKTGAFSVFSKSKDITDQESAEIREMMIYKIPSGLPYEPTVQEIEDLFPKKSGYFFLSSGRACLAQTCYVGRVYSDLDGRSGNYIIHAFVFEKTDDFVPYSFFEHTLFRRLLTKKEWHDDPIPDELPQIELPENGVVLSMNEAASFFNEDSRNKIKILIESFINSSIDNPVYFFDTPKNHKYWFKTLSVCLPKIIQNKVSFCTHFSNTLIPGNISSHIQIRVNQPETNFFNYTEEAQKENYAFDFSRNIISKSIKPGKYTETITALFLSGIFEAGEFADNINKIMLVYSVNISEALDLINMNNSEFTQFKNSEEFINTMFIVDRIGYETQYIADILWKKKLQFNFNTEQKLAIMTFIYKYTSLSIRIEIIKKIIDNAEQYGISVNGAKAFRDDLNSKAYFILENYYDYLEAEGFADYAVKYKNSFLKLYMASNYLLSLPVVKSSLTTQNNNAIKEMNTIQEIMNSTYKQQSVYDLDLLIESANSHINGQGLILLFNSIKNMINSGSRINNIQYAFDILQRLHLKTDCAYYYLLYLIKMFSDQDEFIKKYIGECKKDSAFFTRFENENKNDPLIVNFCKRKDIFCFENNPLSIQIFKEYFDKYFVTGEDTGLFVKRLNEHFNAIQGERKINECINFLNTVKLPINADKNIMLPVYEVILTVVFSAPYGKINELCKKQEYFNKINEIYSEVIKGGISLKQETHELILITFCGKCLEKYAYHGNDQIYLFFSKTQKDANSIEEKFNLINYEKSIDTFINYYFHLAANILVTGACGGKLLNYDDVIIKTFGKIIEKGNLEKITDIIINEINRSKINTVVFILYIFKKNLANTQNIVDKKLGDIAENYFEKLSSGNRKKTFTELLDMAKPEEIKSFERYIEEFNKNHKSGLFNFLIKKK